MSRTRITPPPGGWPWQQPGYTFATGWPTGYKPRLADEALMTKSERKKQDSTLSVLKRLERTA